MTKLRPSCRKNKNKKQKTKNKKNIETLKGSRGLKTYLQVWEIIFSNRKKGKSVRHHWEKQRAEIKDGAH